LLAGGVALAAARASVAAQRLGAEEKAEAAEVEALGRKAGLGRLGIVPSEHFLALGDAPDDFRRTALRRCEAVSDAFLKHFQSKGFRLAFPAQRLTVVVLKDVTSYGALLGEAPGKDVGGHYDLETNRLVMFDFRPRAKIPLEQAERLNLFTLVHEIAHQLSFNTGLFQRTRVPPLCLSEGLATYVELWQPDVKNAIGGVNRPRLQALRDAEDWIPIGDLLNSDQAFRAETDQLAYAESWLLVHHFLRTGSGLPRFREYLAALGSQAKPDAARLLGEKLLGPLSKLDRTLKDEARRYLRA
jgi:hypothetical protein